MRSDYDSYVYYIQLIYSSLIYLVLYVDDILIANKNMSL